jgi:predicted metal-dependent phosphoesterase TrpH
MYKIETHLHTKIVSACGWLSPEEIISGYKEKEYDAVTVTDHFHRGWLGTAGITLGQGINVAAEFLRGYDAVFEAGEKAGIKVYYGAELRFDENDNDYLLLGYEKELLNNTDEILRMGIGEFSKIVKHTGALIIQAHPCRTGKNACVPADQSFLDGVEVYNMNKRQNNNNDKALAFAKKNKLIMMSGSDCHRLEDIGLSGILSDTLPEDSFSYAELIRSRKFTLIGE